MSHTNNLFFDITFNAFFYFSIFVALLAMLVGIWLLVAPDSLSKLKKYSDMQFSLRRSLRPLEIPRYQERLIYRHHKLFGVIIAMGSIYSLTLLTFDISPRTNLLYQSGSSFDNWSLLVTAGQWLLYIGNLFSLIIGVLMLARPSLLKDFEAASNTWLSTRKVLRPLETNYSGVDKFIYQKHRAFGVLLIIVSIYITLNLLFHANKLT